MTAFLTGISGFLAGHLARRLQAQGQTVVGYGRRPPEGLDGVGFVPGDLRDAEALAEALAATRPEVVYHLAALSTLQSAADPEGVRAMLEVNVAGTLRLLDACRATAVPAVVVASSDKQYGARAAIPYDDADTAGFVNGGVYELSKAQADQGARLYAGLFDTPAVRVARLVNLYGPGDTQWSRIVPGTIRRTIEGIAPRVTAGPAGAATREYLFVEDAVTALSALADDARASGNAPHRQPDGRLARVGFNVGSPHRHAAGEAIALIQRVLAQEFGVVGPPPEILPGMPGVFEGGSQSTDTARLQALLPGWAPRSFADGLRATLPWYLDRLR